MNTYVSVVPIRLALVINDVISHLALNWLMGREMAHDHMFYTFAAAKGKHNEFPVCIASRKCNFLFCRDKERSTSTKKKSVRTSAGSSSSNGGSRYTNLSPIAKSRNNDYFI